MAVRLPKSKEANRKTVAVKIDSGDQRCGVWERPAGVVVSSGNVQHDKGHANQLSRRLWLVRLTAAGAGGRILSMDDEARMAAIAAELPAVHPATALFPLLAPDELCALATDIADHGLRFPIVRHDGAILDGRNRWIACRLAELEPTFTEYANGGSPTAYVVSMNLKRRDLTAGQRAVLAVELEKMLAEEAKARMRKGGELAGRGRKARERIPYPVGKAADQAGSLLHVSGRYVSAAKKLVAEAPEAADLVREGRVTLPDAKHLIDVSITERRAAVVKIRNGEAKTVRAALPAPQSEWQRTRAAADLHALLDRVHWQWPAREWGVFADELREHALRIAKQAGVQSAEAILPGPGDMSRGSPEGSPVVEDITERRRAEAERAAAEASLRARAEVEHLKDDLTNMVVHDLKDPVNGIAMLVQLTLRKGQVSTMQRNSLLQIERSCGEMLRLIDNLLEISKLEDGKMPVHPEPIVLGEIVDEVAAEYGPVAAATGRRLTAAIGPKLPRIVADRVLLKRVLINLVANALRHSDSKDVRVEATHDPATARVRLQVIDHGRGIAEADQARLFEKFAPVRRSDDSERSSDRAFGLPFCKLATEAMGGEIAVSSRPEAGTVFTVALPSEPAE